MMANLRSYNSELESKMDQLKTATEAQINTFSREMAAKNQAFDVMKTQFEKMQTDLGYANDNVRKLKNTNQTQKDEIKKLKQKKIDKST